MIRGLDVSHHQTRPDVVPWAGCAFGCVRITWGVEGVDAKAAEHMRYARKANPELLLVAYHYQKDQPGHVQANHYHKRRHELEAEFGPIACATDLEDMVGANGKPIPWDAVKYSLACASFIVQHRATTPRPLLIYGNTMDLTRYAYGQDPDREPLWLADWTAPYPAPKPWKKWTLLQHKGGGTTGFDENRYDGTLDELRALLLPDIGGAHDSLGGVVSATNAAMGYGASVEDFVSRDEGPEIG